MKIDCFAVYTNTVPASSYRGLGGAQVTFPGESQIDELAEKSGVDPSSSACKIWRRAANRFIPACARSTPIFPATFAKPPGCCSMDRPLAPRHGRSVCCSASDAGAHPVTLAMVQVYADGAVSVLSGSTEIGQGSHTVLAQIAAEEMGVPLEKVRLIGSDTAVTLFERSTGASRTTTLMGRAVLEACREAIAQMQGDGGGSVRSVPRKVWSRNAAACAQAEAYLTWAEILERYFQMEGCSIVGRAYLRKAGDLTAGSSVLGNRRGGRGDCAGRGDGTNFVWTRWSPSAMWAWRFIRR